MWRKLEYLIYCIGNLVYTHQKIQNSKRWI